MATATRKYRCFLFFLLVSVIATHAGRSHAKNSATDRLKIVSEAMEASDITEIRSLIERGADVNVRSVNGKTSLFIASERGYNEIVKLLIQAKANVNTSVEGFTPLLIAVQQGHSEIVKLLIEKKANINASNLEGLTPLYDASAWGRVEIVKMLIDAQADVNIVNKSSGLTPLGIAAALPGSSDNAVLESAVYAMDNVNAVDEYNFDLRAGTRPQSRINVAALLESVLLMSANPDKDSLINQSRKLGLLRIAGADTAKIVKLLIEAGSDVNAVRRPDFATPLHLAAAADNREAIKLLIEEGADVNAASTDGITPLHLAAGLGSSKVVKLLIEAKADVNAGKKDGLTPLFWASKQGHSEAVKLLIEAGADVNASTTNDITPLHLAVQEGHSEAVQLLIEAGADVNAFGAESSCPLYLASSMGNGEIVKLLIDAGADVNVFCGRSGNFTPLHIAAQEGHGEVIKLLVDAGADVHAWEKESYRTPEDIASKKGHREIVKLLKAAGKAPSTKPTAPEASSKPAVDVKALGRKEAERLGFNPIYAYMNDDGAITIAAGSKGGIVNGEFTLVEGDMLINIGEKPLEVDNLVLQKGEYAIAKEDKLQKGARVLLY